MKHLRTFNESKKAKFPNIKTFNFNNYVILLGKDALSNDYLSTTMAKPEDLWFHASKVPGSHVVIQSQGADIPEDVIKFAAELAAKNSKSKVSPTVVIYCLAKYVTKKLDMEPGEVNVDYKHSDYIKV